MTVGTSTYHMMIPESFGEVPGIDGIVPDGIVRSLWGCEAGQVGTGDIFGWFVDNCVPPSYIKAVAARGVEVHEYLTELAARQRASEYGLLALD